MAEGAKWVKTWINNLAALNDQFRDDDGRIDFEALGREEYAFRMALSRRDFSKSERAAEAWKDSQGRWEASVENGKKGGRPKRNSESKKKDEKSNFNQEKTESQPQNQQPPKPPTQKEPKPEQNVYGRFENVFLTQEEYSELARMIGNVNELNNLIDSFGASLEDGSKTSNNHFATLSKWAQYRKDKDKEKEERQNANNETFAEREGKRCRKILEQFGMIK